MDEKDQELASSPTPSAQEGGLLRLATEMGPLVLFFLANARWGIYVATGVLMVAIVAALVVAWTRERRLPIMPLITAGFVLVFGGLTLWLHDDLFIKLKPTIVNVLFATILFVGLARGRIFLQLVLGQALALSPEGWRKLTLRWGFFFLFLAVVNEVVRRSFSNDFWVTFKTWGVLPLTVAFMASQVPLLRRYAMREEG